MYFSQVYCGFTGSCGSVRITPDCCGAHRGVVVSVSRLALPFNPLPIGCLTGTRMGMGHKAPVVGVSNSKTGDATCPRSSPWQPSHKNPCPNCNPYSVSKRRHSRKAIRIRSNAAPLSQILRLSNALWRPVTRAALEPERQRTGPHCRVCPVCVRAQSPRETYLRNE